MASKSASSSGCACGNRLDWAVIDDEQVMRWQAVDIAEWEEIRQCPECGTTWLAVWPEESEAPPILCRPRPNGAKKLREIDHPGTLRAYCLSRLEEQLGEVKERKGSCRKVNCSRNRIAGTTYCLEHLIAERFGRHLARLEAAGETPAPAPLP